MARVTDKDLTKSVSKTKTVGNGVVKPTSQTVKVASATVIYNKNGEECDVLAQDQIMAKSVVGPQSRQFLVRINRRNELYQPYDKMFVDEAYRIGRLEGTAPHSLAECGVEAFQHYIKFLQTKNNSFLALAQRGF